MTKWIKTGELIYKVLICLGDKELLQINKPKTNPAEQTAGCGQTVLRERNTNASRT